VSWFPAAVRRTGAALPAISVALLTLVVGGFRAGNRQLWDDEYATWYASTLNWPDFVRLIGHIDFVLAPYYVFMHGWMSVFGDSPLAMRAPSVLAMAASAGLLTVVGRRLFSTGVGLLAGLLFAAVPSVSRYAQEARPYALAMLFAVLTTLLLLRAMERPTWPRWLWYGGGLILLGLTHMVALSIVVAHGFAVAVTARTEDRLKVWRFSGPVLGAVSVVVPFGLTAAREEGAVDWIRTDRGTLRAFPGLLFGSVAVAGLLVVLAVVAMYLLVHTTGAALPLATAWALAPPALTFAAFPLAHLFHYRYLLFTVPAWTLLAAAGVVGLARALATRVRRIPVPAAVAVVATAALVAIGWLGLAGQIAARHDPLTGYPDYRQAAHIISAALRPGDSIVYGGAGARRGMTYEMRTMLRPHDVFLYQSAERRGRFSAEECPAPAACLGTTQRIWLVNTVATRDDLAGLAPAVATLLRDQFTTGQRWEYQHLRLVLLTPRVDNPFPDPPS
jgi:mannosyltransferase